MPSGRACKQAVEPPQACNCIPAVLTDSLQPLAPADDHFVKWGCYWNRDIAKLVRQAGLEVESQSR